MKNKLLLVMIISLLTIGYAHSQYAIIESQIIKATSTIPQYQEYKFSGRTGYAYANKIGFVSEINKIFFTSNVDDDKVIEMIKHEFALLNIEAIHIKIGNDLTTSSNVNTGQDVYLLIIFKETLEGDESPGTQEMSPNMCKWKRAYCTTEWYTITNKKSPYLKSNVRSTIGCTLIGGDHYSIAKDGMVETIYRLHKAKLLNKKKKEKKRNKATAKNHTITPPVVSSNN